MNICFLQGRLVLQQVLALIEVVLGPHASLGSSDALSPSPLASCRPPSIGRIRIIEVVEVVEHQVHILLLLPL
jgi:hypothetical protein